MSKAVILDAAKHAYEARALAEDLTSKNSKLKETQNLPFFRARSQNGEKRLLASSSLSICPSA
jgi:hypothetical protein